MPSAQAAQAAVVVDGTRRECAGVIAVLERTMETLPEGATVEAVVGDVPTHIEVLAWAERKGHAVANDRREERRFRLEIVKAGGRRLWRRGERSPTG